MEQRFISNDWFYVGQCQVIHMTKLFLITLALTVLFVKCLCDVLYSNIQWSWKCVAKAVVLMFQLYVVIFSGIRLLFDPKIYKQRIKDSLLKWTSLQEWCILSLYFLIYSSNRAHWLKNSNIISWSISKSPLSLWHASFRLNNSLYDPLCIYWFGIKLIMRN